MIEVEDKKKLGKDSLGDGAPMMTSGHDYQYCKQPKLQKNVHIFCTYFLIILSWILAVGGGFGQIGKMATPDVCLSLVGGGCTLLTHLHKVAGWWPRDDSTIAHWPGWKTHQHIAQSWFGQTTAVPTVLLTRVRRQISFWQWKSPWKIWCSVLIVDLQSITQTNVCIFH